LNLVQSNIKKLIEEKAFELGFVKIGFTRAEVLETESGLLKKWLDKGLDGDMNWIKKGFEKRKDVKLIMQDAISVISLAYNYYTPFKHDEDKPKISRYAWGRDYHKILKEKLKELCRYIETAPHVPPKGGKGKEQDKYKSLFLKGQEFIEVSKSPFLKGDERSEGGFPALAFYVDDGPVMDKAWAVRSGVGWMGKHTNVINPEYGSWIFLCEIITNLEFDTYDKPIEDLCGSCRICIDACPTGAIVDEYILDANLCISYQTIENRSDIPDYIDLNGWIFGCDVCQDVCPFNKNDKVTNDKNFYPAPLVLPKGEKGLNVGDKNEPPFGEEGTASKSPFLKGEERSSGGFPTKAELEAITEKEFNTIFADSPIKRAKFKGWKRNLERT
jgi:epoxyqueuosine reductase